MNQVALTRELEDADFQVFSQYANDFAGIQLHDGKRHLVISRLIRRVRSLGLSSLADYRTFLQNNTSAEREHFINAITTNLTSFFRESHHFDYFKDWALKEHHGQIRVWSSACSTGQEPYSIAIAAQEAGFASRCAIHATDIDSQCVGKAQQGIYPITELEELDTQACKRHFLRGDGDNAGKVRVKSHLTDMVEFRQLNLLEDWPQDLRFDVIFCRNVFIYFDEATQNKILRKFYQVLEPNGVLFLGHSESQRDTADLFAMDGRTTFRRMQG